MSQRSLCAACSGIAGVVERQRAGAGRCSALAANACRKPAVETSRDESGVLIVDAGIDAPRSVAAGAAIAEICMGGLGVGARRGGSFEQRATKNG